MLEEKEEPKEDLSEKKKTYYSKILKITLYTSMVILIFIIAFFFFIKASVKSDFDGVKFTMIQEGDLVFYQTSIPFNNNGNLIPYYFYLRTSPKDLKQVPSELDNFSLMQLTAWSVQGNIDCNGYGNLAVQNLVLLHNATGLTFVRDDNATCDPRYNLIRLMPGDKTEIIYAGENCYNLTINNCEVFKPTERYFVEILVKLKELGRI